MLLAKVWYFLSTGGQAFVLPYFNVYFDQLGFSKDAIGVLSALRPWLSAPCAVLLCALADRLSCHTSLLVVTFAASLLLRCLLLLVPPQFLTVAALVLLSDCIGAPVGAIVDATVVGACKSDGDYGKHRMWASAAWGGLSVVAGSLVAQRGLGAGFFMYLLMSMPCIFIAFRLRKSAEAEKAAAAAAAAASAPTCSVSPLDMQQKLAQKPTDASRTQPAAAAEPTEELTEDLMARLLPGTPDSLSSYGGSSCATSSCGGSRPCSPDLGMPARCASPFSRFAATSFGRSLRIREVGSGAEPEAAEYGGRRLQEGGVGSPGVHVVEQAGLPAAAGGNGMIKAWYAEEEPGEAQQQQQQQKAAAVSPAAAAAEILAGRSCPQHPAGEQDEAGAAAVAGVGADGEIGSAAIYVSTAAAAETKQSAKLELGASQQLQSSYSLVEWQNDKAGAKAAATPAAALASRHAAEREDEGAALLAADAKQPLPLVAAAAEGAAAGAAEAAAAAEGGAAARGAAGDDVTIRALLASPAVLVFMWRALIIGLGLGTIGNFLFLHVEELGGTASLMGLMLFFNCVTEVPAFHFQSVILDRLPVPLVFNGSMLLLALRLAGYGFLPLLHSPWPVLALELLHGCTFASSWGAGIVHCMRLAPPHLNASMQGLFSSLYGGVGSGLGALLGGVLMQQLGGQALFFICSLVVLAGWLVGYVVELLLVGRGRKVQA